MRSYIKRSKNAANLIEFNATKLAAVPRMALMCYKRRPGGAGFIIIIIIIKYKTHQSRCSSTDKREKYRGMAKTENYSQEIVLITCSTSELDRPFKRKLLIMSAHSAYC